MAALVSSFCYPFQPPACPLRRQFRRTLHGEQGMVRSQHRNHGCRLLNYRFKNGKVLTPTGQPIRYLWETFLDRFAGSDYDHYPVVDKNGMLMRMEDLHVRMPRNSSKRTRVGGGGREENGLY